MYLKKVHESTQKRKLESVGGRVENNGTFNKATLVTVTSLKIVYL